MFDGFFEKATGNRPYPFQRRLALGESWPEVMHIPTGLGKTAAVILSWIYRRRYSESARSSTPRRLVYCLPMRTLVEQTESAARQWLEAHELSDATKDGIGLHVLMGGSDDGDWYKHPERDAILIGTQDMLLSRALNRGYGMSRYQWPVQYALLNNDCLWVLDETQLMGVGLTTSAQLQGLRDRLQTYGSCQTLWMSATLHLESLATVDHPLPTGGQWWTETLEEDDFSSKYVHKLITAAKPLKQASVTLSGDAKSQKKYPGELANLITARHQPETLTLVVLNRVSRAQDVFAAIKKRLGQQAETDVRLIHSRFRPQDRAETQRIALDEKEMPKGGRILVATQAIEAGVDLSATTLLTELAPWSSLVQRFGRCNRRGDCGIAKMPAAQIDWIDIETARTKPNELLPYTAEELDLARQSLKQISDAGPQSLAEIDVEEITPLVHVIRRKDVLELFDTTPDLSGNDLDVSRYIRETEDKDLQVYWRDWDLTKSNPKRIPEVAGKELSPEAAREELCSVPIAGFATFLSLLNKEEKTKHLAWIWNPLEGIWEECRSPRPGQTVLLHRSAGGYDSELGWTGDLKNRLPASELSEDQQAGVEAQATMVAMDQEETGACVSLQRHLLDVKEEAQGLRDAKEADWDETIPWSRIISAAHWHDVGKAHAAFQAALRGINPELEDNEFWAKSGMPLGRIRYAVTEDNQTFSRRGFRHELVSSLAYLQQHRSSDETNLIAYLIAAHHGKVRLSIRSMPNETKPPQSEEKPERLFARGIWDGDALPAIDLGDGEVSEPLSIDLSLMQLGDHVDKDGEVHPSWLSRTLQLRDDYGPFRLAFLETLVRVADWRASVRGDQR